MSLGRRIRRYFDPTLPAPKPIRSPGQTLRGFFTIDDVRSQPPARVPHTPPAPPRQFDLNRAIAELRELYVEGLGDELKPGELIEAEQRWRTVIAKLREQGTPDEDSIAALRNMLRKTIEEKNTPAPEDHDAPPARALDLSRDLRMRHIYAIGKSGTGKTTLLKQLLLHDFIHGDGCAFIDPHGDAAFDLLGYVPEDRRRDVTYFDPTSPSAPAFNLLALPYPAPKLAEDILSTFKLLFGSSWGPRLEHLLRFSLLTLLADSEPHSLKDVQTLLRRADYRDELVARARNEQVREFWLYEFPSMPKDSASPILNKLSALLTPTSDLERVLSSTANALDFPAILDSGGIFIANLAKGKLGDEPSRLLGALLATAIQQAALARADRPAESRRDFYFYVDEFQNYAVASFGTILSEARKYKLSLTLANQTLSQIPSELRDAIFGNVATLVAFQVSADDASRLVREMHSSRVRIVDHTEDEEWSLDRFKRFADKAYDHLRKHYVAACLQCASSFSFSASSASPDDPASDRFLFGQFAERVQQIDNARAYFSQSSFSTPELRNIISLVLSPIHYRKASAPIGAMLLQNPDDVRVQRDGASLDFHDDGGHPFRDFKIVADDFPTVNDLLNLTPLHAFLRVERAENVSPLIVERPPPPDASTRDAILAQQAARAHASSPVPPTPRPSPAPPVEPIVAVVTPSEEPEASIAADDAAQSRRDKYSF